MFHQIMLKYVLKYWYISWDKLGTIKLWDWSIILIWRMYLYLTFWDKLILRLLTSWWFSVVRVGKVFSRYWQKYRGIHYILSGLDNWPWNTCSSTSCSVKCRKWEQYIIHYMHGFRKFQDVNSWIVEQGSIYSSRGITSNYIWYKVCCMHG